MPSGIAQEFPSNRVADGRPRVGKINWRKGNRVAQIANAEADRAYFSGLSGEHSPVVGELQFEGGLCVKV